MIGSLAVFAALVCLSNVAGQPVSCKEDAQCPEGFFCEADAHNCRECLRCQDLKRKPPLVSPVDQCVKSVSECGDCYDGLELDRRRGDVNAECVAIVGGLAAAPESGAAEGASHTWLYVIVALVAVALVLGVLIVLLLRRDIFKTAGSGQNSVTATITASAPEAPPPYNAVPADSGPYYNGNGHAHNGHTRPYDEDQHPFISKPATSPGQRREAAGSQAARVYEEPFYMRKHQPHNPGSPVSDTDDTAFFADEETTESVWTPHATLANGDGNTNSESGASGAVAGAGESSVDAGAGPGALALQLQLAAARRTELLDVSPAKKMRLPQDSNNNRNRETSTGSDSESCPRPPSPGHAGHGAHAGHAPHATHAPGAPPYNFTTQIINVVQFNANK